MLVAAVCTADMVALASFVVAGTIVVVVFLVGTVVVIVVVSVITGAVAGDVVIVITNNVVAVAGVDTLRLQRSPQQGGSNFDQHLKYVWLHFVSNCRSMIF